jgi:hypothetical protein
MLFDVLANCINTIIATNIPIVHYSVDVNRRVKKQVDLTVNTNSGKMINYFDDRTLFSSFLEESFIAWSLT